MAQLDRSRLHVRRALTRALVAVLVGVLGVTMAVCAAALLVLGISGSLGALLGAAWLGHLATGLLFLGGGALAFAVWRARRRRRAFQALVQKYERLTEPPESWPHTRPVDAQVPEL